MAHWIQSGRRTPRRPQAIKLRDISRQGACVSSFGNWLSSKQVIDAHCDHHSLVFPIRVEPGTDPDLQATRARDRINVDRNSCIRMFLKTRRLTGADRDARGNASTL